jgi:hypothetical protein
MIRLLYLLCILIVLVPVLSVLAFCDRSSKESRS